MGWDPFEDYKPTKLLDKLTPQSHKDVRSAATKLQARGYAKLGTSGRKGSSSGRAWDMLTMGSLREENLNRSWAVADDPSMKNAERASRGYVKADVEAHKSANMGHQVVRAFQEELDYEDPPPTPELPAMGGNVTSAKAAARRRAIEMAKGRFGMKGTVTTTPLGLTGEGAPLGKKTLIGT